MNLRRITFITDSVKGVRRKTNKDGVLAITNENYHILGVFDGVSSAVGSRQAVKFAISHISKNHINYFHNGRLNLSEMMRDLNIKLINTNINEPFTTYSVVCIPKNSSKKIKISSLGDSRIYSVAKQYLLRRSEDDNHLLHSNILTKYLGNTELTQKDFSEIEFSGPEKSFLICTDGFYTTIEQNSSSLSEVHRVLNFQTLHSIKNGISKVIKGANADDASFVFVRWENV